MKRLINLGIVLGIVLVIIGCQKEEYSPAANSWDKTTPAVDYTAPNPASIFEPVPTRTGSPYSPGSVFEPAPANTPGIYLPPVFSTPIGSGNTITGDNQETPVSNSPNWPDDKTTNWPELPSDINERGYAIHWQYEKPQDAKWKLIEAVSDENNASRDYAVPTTFCPYDDCDEVISQAVANLQVQANILCQDLYACVVCCMDGYVVYAMLVAFHDCGIIAPPSEF